MREAFIWMFIGFLLWLSVADSMIREDVWLDVWCKTYQFSIHCK